MNAYLAAALSTALLVLPSGALAQQAPDEGFVVSGVPEVRNWTDNVGQKLDDQLAYQERMMRPGEAHTGIVQLRFSRGVDGSPRDIEVYRSAASSAVKSSARRAVSRLRDLPPLPAAHAATNEVIVNILLANDEAHMRHLSRKLAGWEAERLARSTAERRVLAFNSTRR